MNIDLSYLKEMSAGNVDLLKELTSVFNEQKDELIAEMQKHLEQKNWSLLAKTAHKAKASVNMLGLSELSTKLKRLETFAKQGKKTEIYDDLVSEFIQSINNASSELDIAINEPDKYLNN